MHKDLSQTLGLGVAFVIVAILFIVSLDSTDQQGAVQTAEQSAKKKKVDEWESWAHGVVNRIHYFKDPRTNICFAYYYGADRLAGSGLAAVSCDAIPPDLLVTANVGGKGGNKQ